MSSDNPGGSDTSDMPPDQLRWLDFIEHDSTARIDPPAAPTLNTQEVAEHAHEDLVDLFAILQLEMTYGLRMREKRTADLEKDLTRYKKDVADGRNVIDRLVQIIMIDMLQKGGTLRFDDLNPVINAAIADHRLKDTSPECLLFIARNMLNILNERKYLEPAVPRE